MDGGEEGADPIQVQRRAGDATDVDRARNVLIFNSAYEQTIYTQGCIEEHGYAADWELGRAYRK